MEYWRWKPMCCHTGDKHVHAHEHNGKTHEHEHVHDAEHHKHTHKCCHNHWRISLALSYWRLRTAAWGPLDFYLRPSSLLESLEPNPQFLEFCITKRINIMNVAISLCPADPKYSIWGVGLAPLHSGHYPNRRFACLVRKLIVGLTGLIRVD